MTKYVFRVEATSCRTVCCKIKYSVYEGHCWDGPNSLTNCFRDNYFSMLRWIVTLMKNLVKKLGLEAAVFATTPARNWPHDSVLFYSLKDVHFYWVISSQCTHQLQLPPHPTLLLGKPEAVTHLKLGFKKWRTRWMADHSK
jgi:hypothetical protein